MKITFTDEAKKRVERYLGPNKKILLDYDDGVGPFSAIGNCSLENGYQLIFVDQDISLPDFDRALESNIGQILIKGESLPQFEDEMEIRFNQHLFTMPLVSRKGILTDNIEVIDYSGIPLPTQQGGRHMIVSKKLTAKKSWAFYYSKNLKSSTNTNVKTLNATDPQ